MLWDADNRLVMCNSKFQNFHHLPSERVAAGTPYAQVMAQGHLRHTGADRAWRTAARRRADL